jgi:D-threo-aldose 1-dehydrogenase
MMSNGSPTDRPANSTTPSLADRTPLGASGVVVSRLAVGTQPLGGRFEAVSDDQAQATLERAWELGINFFDTAPLYGRGLAERRLGRFLADHAQEAVVSTKVGRLLDQNPSPEARIERTAVRYSGAPELATVWDFSYEGAVRSLNSSLERLGVASLDIVCLHDISTDTIEEAMSGAYRALLDFREEGRIRAIGVGTDHTVPLIELARVGGFDCFVLPGRFTLLDQSGLELLDLCVDRGISIIAAAVFGYGILADPRRWRSYYDEVVIKKALAIEHVCSLHGVPLAAAAMQFPFRHPAIDVVLLGVRSPEEVDLNAELLSLPIPVDLWDELRSEGFIAPSPGAGASESI